MSPFPHTEDTVPKERQHDEVDGEHHAALHTPLRLDAVVHDLIPVFARQDLKGEGETHSQPPLNLGPLGDAAVEPEPAVWAPPWPLSLGGEGLIGLQEERAVPALRGSQPVLGKNDPAGVTIFL